MASINQAAAVTGGQHVVDVVVREHVKIICGKNKQHSNANGKNMDGMRFCKDEQSNARAGSGALLAGMARVWYGARGSSNQEQHGESGLCNGISAWQKLALKTSTAREHTLTHAART